MNSVDEQAAAAAWLVRDEKAASAGLVAGSPMNDWRELAACRGHPTAWWFALGSDPEARAKARAICNSCTVRAECLEYALSCEGTGVHGMYGGLSAHARRHLHHVNPNRQATA